MSVPIQQKVTYPDKDSIMCLSLKVQHVSLLISNIPKNKNDQINVRK